MNKRASKILASAILMAACGGESKSAESSGTVPVGSERFVLVQRVIAEEDRQQYVHVLDGLPEGRLDTANALEIAGYAQFNYHDGYLYVSNGDDLSLRRYVIDDDGALSEQGVLSFTDFGIASSPVPEFVGNEAWIWNGPEVIIVDLDKFEIITPEPLDFSEIFDGIPDSLVPQAYATGAAFQSPARVRDGKLYVTVYAMNYDDPLAADGYFPRARVATINVATREVVAVADDERCTADADTSPVEQDGGFWVTGTAAQTFETAWGDGRHSCMLRFDTDKGEFDPNGYIDLHALTGGYEALEMNWFSDGVFYFPATDVSAYSQDEDRWNAILGSNPAAWMRIDVRAKDAVKITGDGVGPMGPWGNAWLHETRVFLDVTRGASGVQSDETTLVEVDPETHVASERFSYAGDAVGFFQVAAP
jgi:hypothetical protein